METLIKSFVHIAPSDFYERLHKQAAVMLTHYEEFLGRLTENMQARCANNLMM